MVFNHVWVMDSFEIAIIATNILSQKIFHTEKNLYVTSGELNDPLKRYMELMVENSILGWASGTAVKITPASESRLHS